MQRAVKFLVCALVLAILGSLPLYGALSAEEPEKSAITLGLMLEAWAVGAAAWGAWLWYEGRGGCKARLRHAFEITGPLLLRLGPIRGTGPGLVELAVGPEGVLVKGVPCQMRLALTSGDFFAKEWHHVMTDRGSIGATVTHAIRQAGSWELAIEVLWPKQFFEADLLKRMRQFRQAMKFELVIRGRCTDVTIPPVPEFAPADVEGGRRGFEVVMNGTEQRDELGR